MSTLVPALSAVAAILAAFGTFLVSRRKVAAEVESTTVATALSLLEPMRQQIAQLEARIEGLEARDLVKTQRIDDLEEGVRILTQQIHELGDLPRWPGPPVRRTHQGD